MARPVANPAAFRAEAQWQKVCAVCGSPGAFQAHHVIKVQTLRRYGLHGNALYDTRNALRLCEGLDTRRCHMQHENRRTVVPTIYLRDDNLTYAFELMGLYAADFIRREYDDSIEDPRIIELESMHRGAA